MSLCAVRELRYFIVYSKGTVCSRGTAICHCASLCAVRELRYVAVRSKGTEILYCVQQGNCVQ